MGTDNTHNTSGGGVEQKNSGTENGGGGGNDTVYNKPSQTIDDERARLEPEAYCALPHRSFVAHSHTTLEK